MKQAYIFDIDGTLANVDHRTHYVRDGKKQWKKFFDAMAQDTLVEPVATLCKDLYVSGAEIILCSGRPDNYREITENWLKEHAIPYNVLYMRAAGDYRPDTVVKQEMLNEIKKYNDIILVVDDRPSVVDMWRENDITCLQCAPDWENK